MQQYLKNFIPRLNQFSRTLDQIESFVDKPWIFIDEKNNKHTYIFQRDKSLIMSLNGIVEMIGNLDRVLLIGFFDRKIYFHPIIVFPL
jgi:hypothetical protein